MLKNILNKIRKKIILNAFDTIVKKNNEIIIQNYQKFIDYQTARVKEEVSRVKEEVSRVKEEVSRVKEEVSRKNYSNIQRLLTIHDLHQKTFLPFKNRYIGKRIVLVGAGPSVNNFIPIKNAIYVGLNRAFKLGTVSFDYLFSTDFEGIKDYYDDFLNYRGDECIKFIGDQNLPLQMNKQIPEGILTNSSIKRFMTNTPNFEYKFTKDIDSEPLNNSCTVSLQAMQFILYTNPQKIYLVGIDCSSAGHFIGNDSEKINNELATLSEIAVAHYKELKNFIKIYYPNTEIISVNPVNLRGLFKDWDQDMGNEPK